MIEGNSRQALDELDNRWGCCAGSPSHGPLSPTSTGCPPWSRPIGPAGCGRGERITPTPLPRLVSTTAYRIVAEGLTNAERYGGDGRSRCPDAPTPTGPWGA